MPVFLPKSRFRHAFLIIVKELCRQDTQFGLVELVDTVINKVDKIYSDRSRFSTATMELHEFLQR